MNASTAYILTGSNTPVIGLYSAIRAAIATGADVVRVDGRALVAFVADGSVGVGFGASADERAEIVADWQ